MEAHLLVTENSPDASELLASDTGISKAKIKQAMQKGAVWISGNRKTERLRRPKKLLRPGDQLHLYYNEDVLKKEVSMPTLISDNSEYSIWYKPYGVLSQGSKWGDHCTIDRMIEIHTQKRAYLVHRLDRATTGLMIIAHKKNTAAQLSKLFRDRAIDKRYLAIVVGEFPNTGDIQTIMSIIDGKKAISHVSKLSYCPHLQQSLVDIKIETGRKHQIRRQLSESGHPIIGDRLYGQPEDNSEHTDNLQLCCYSLAFRCPTSGADKHYELDAMFRPALTVNANQDLRQ
jgi:tRNA pseudouridine32 synthase/23S rRNA pseudouridine746 synthase